MSSLLCSGNNSAGRSNPCSASLIFALAGALVLTVTLMPVLSYLFLRSRPERDTWMLRFIRRIYEPSLAWTMRHPVPVTAIAGLLFLSSLWTFSSLGTEFVPRLDEGDIAINAWRLPSVSLSESIVSTTEIERVLGHFQKSRPSFPATSG